MSSKHQEFKGIVRYFYMQIVEFSKDTIKMIDQRKLPYKEEYVECKTVKEVSDAIRTMVVRGAPAIGVAAAYGMALSKDLKEDAQILKSSRPTAVDLSNAVDFMLNEIEKGNDPLKSAKEFHKQIKEKTKKISENGASLIKDGDKILLHCNAGPLATAAYGTSLGAVIEAHKKKNIMVFVDETRPRIQGALTSWELSKAGVPHKVIVDSSAGSLMKRKMIDLVMVGADRIISNGDFANKIGTYSLGVLAKENKIPFYVLAPISSFDFSIYSGEGIKIEERDEKEVLEILGKKIYPEGTSAFNPAFDVTPKEYVTGYITEFGIHKNTNEIEAKWKNTKE